MAGDKEVSVWIRGKETVGAAAKAALGGLKSFAAEAGRLLTSVSALIGGAALGAFFKGAVEESMSAQRAFDQLGLVLANIGVDFQKVRPEVDQVFTSLQQLAGIDDDEAAGALAALVRTSGDYQASLKAMPLVADLAKGANLELADAAQVIGKALVGNVKGLKEYGVTAKDTAGALAQLQTKFGGEAERFGQSFEGVLKRTKEGFNNFLQAVGDLITGNRTVNEEVLRAADGFQRLAEWIATHSDEAGYYFTVLIRGTEASAKTLWGLVRVAFNVGEAIGHLFLSLGNDLYAMVLWGLDQAAKAANTTIESLNRLPGVEIQFRVPRFDRELAEARGASAKYLAAAGQDALDIKDAVEGVADAWAEMSLAAERAAAESSAAGVRAARAIRQAKGGDGTPFDLAGRKPAGIAETPGAGGFALPTIDLSQIKTVNKLPPVGEAAWLTDLKGQFAAAGEQLQASIGDIIGGAFTGGLGRAKDVALAALGQTFSAMGRAMLTAGGGLKALFPFLANPLSAGPAMVAAGALLVGLGAVLSNIAQGGANRAGGGGFAASQGAIAPGSRDAAALTGSARSKVTFYLPETPMDPLDPRFRRYLGDALEGIADGRDVDIVIGRPA